MRIPTFTWITPTPGTTLGNTATVNASYAVAGFDSGTVRYSINGNPWTTAGDASQNAIAVSVGANTLQLIAEKTTGGVTYVGYSTVNTFNVSALAAPTVTITSPSAGAVVNGDITVTSANGTEYQIDGGAWIALANNIDTTALVNGSHTLRVKGGNPVGYSDIITIVINNGVTPVFTWTTPVTGSTIANTTTANATYTVSNFDNGSVTYSVNGGAWTAAGNTNQNGIAVQTGTNTIQLRATKTVQGVATIGYSSINTFIVANASAPVVTITNPSAGSTVSGNVSVTTINGTEYQIDGGSWIAIATNIDTTALVNGSHTLRVRGGNPLGYSDTITIVVNNGVVPSFTWITPVPGTILSETATVDSTYTVANFDTGSVAYSINGGAWIAAGDAAQNGINVNIGTNTIQLRATKTIQGVTTTGYSSINTFIIASASAPTITITNPSAGSTVSDSVNVTSVNGTEYQIDGGSWVALATAIDTTLLTNGSHILRARGGNPTGYSDISVMTVDNHDLSIPTVSSFTPADGTINVGVSVGFNANDTKIALTFSEPMDALTLNNSNIKLFKYGTDIEVPVNDIMSSSGNTIVHIIPATELDYATQYYITVAGVKDAAGNALTAVWDISNKSSHEFTTVAQPIGILGAEASVMTKSSGTADNTYVNGWEWVMRITLPTNENNLSLKMSDWISGSNVLPAANNIEYYSSQIGAGLGSSASPVQITAANTYPASVLVSSDADPTRAGIQTDIHILVKIPASTPSGSYSASYGIESH